MKKTRKAIIFLIFLLFLTGCQQVTNDDNYLEKVYNVLGTNNTNVNRVSLGYKYYLPFGVNIIYDSDNNQIYKVLDTKMYLYVDCISYYYNDKLNYAIDNPSNNYYYEPINYNGKTGYLLINEEKDKYFVKIIYNYAKIEVYSSKDNLSKIITYATIILNSIEYNDLVIASSVENSANLSTEIDYKIDVPEDSTSKFSQYLEEYVQEEEEIIELPEE